MNKYKIIATCLWLFALFCTACTGQAYPEEQELKEALQHAKQLSLESELTGNTSRLSEAFTEKAIASIKGELARELSNASETNLYEETEVESVKVLEYNPPKVIVMVKYGHELFVQNRVTGEQTEAVPPRREWRTYKIQMLKEDGVWKYDQVVKSIDWGPR